jgi:hypothetical protein
LPVTGAPQCPQREGEITLWYAEANAVSNAIGYAKHRSRSHDAVIRVYDAIAASANRRFQFHNRNQLFIRSHNEALSVPMCVNNPDCSPRRTHA